jgi:hypothetical protein
VIEQERAGYQVTRTQFRSGTGRQQIHPSTVSQELTELARLADRLRTGCVYELQPPGTFGLLVTRDDPRTCRRTLPVLAPIQAHWPLLAPSVYLLTGHEAACRTRRCRGVGHRTGHKPLQLGWPAFAAAYRSELERRSLAERLGVLRQIVAWLCQYPTVTVLSFESGTPQGEALVAWEQHQEFVPWAQRHILREWLVSLLPQAGPGRGGVGNSLGEGDPMQYA